MRKKPKGIVFLENHGVRGKNMQNKKRKRPAALVDSARSKRRVRTSFSNKPARKYNGPIIDLTANSKKHSDKIDYNTDRQHYCGSKSAGSSNSTGFSSVVGGKDIGKGSLKNSKRIVRKSSRPKNIYIRTAESTDDFFQHIVEIDPFTSLLPSPLTKKLSRIQRGFASANAYVNAFLPLHINESIAQVRSQTGRLTRDIDNKSKILPKTPPLRFVVMSNKKVSGTGFKSYRLLTLFIVGTEENGYFEKNVLNAQIHSLRGAKKKGNVSVSSDLRHRIRSHDVILFSRNRSFGNFRAVKTQGGTGESNILDLDHKSAVVEELCGFAPAAIGIVDHATYVNGNVSFDIQNKIRLLQGEKVLFKVSVYVSSTRFANMFDHSAGERSGENVLKEHFANQRLCGWLVDSLNTAKREYDALLDVGRLNILNALLHNKGLQITSPPPAKLNGRAAPGNTQQPFSSSEILMLGNESDLTLSLRFRSYLKMHYNEPQFDAIITAATQKGFTVIQGPPGTGKTQTLLGVLNTLHLHVFGKSYRKLHVSFVKLIKRLRNQCKFDPESGLLLNNTNSHFNSSDAITNRQYTDPEYWWNKWKEVQLPPKPRILMCAPSVSRIFVYLMNLF